MCRDSRDGGLGADQPVADAAGLRGSQTAKPGSEMPARWFPMPGWNGWLGVWVDGSGGIWEPPVMLLPVLPLFGLAIHVWYWLGRDEPGAPKDKDWISY